MGRLHVSLTSRALGYPLRGRIEKTFIKWGRGTKNLRSPGLDNIEVDQ